MIEQMRKDKDAMIKDKDAMMKDKDAMMNQTIKDKGATIKQMIQKSLISKKCFQLMENRALNAEKDIVLIRAKSQAVLANRLILEQALFSFQVGGTFSGRFQKFLHTIVQGGTFQKHGLQTLTMLRGFGLNVQPKDVIKELDGLVHNLCQDIHYGVSTVPGAMENGVYVGGSDPRAAALAVCFRQLQFLNHTDVNMILVTQDAKPICRIENSQLLRI